MKIIPSFFFPSFLLFIKFSHISLFNTIADLLSRLVESEKNHLDGSVYFEEFKVWATEGQPIKEIGVADAT